MKEKVKKLIELIEHNRTTLWNENLEGTSDCIILENVHSKEICLEPHSSDDCEEYNHQFTGGEIEKLIEELKKEI
jgi:hypothetical protein